MKKTTCSDCNSDKVHFDEETEEGKWYSCNRCNAQFCIHNETEVDKKRKAALIRRQAWLDYCTCEKCSEKYNCEHSFDPYNTNGDCLREK